MQPKSEHALSYYAGSRWFMGVVTWALIGIFAFWLLSALLRAQELAEKMVVEQTVQNMRTGLKMAMGEAIVAGRDNEIATWAGANPLRWLGGMPESYARGIRGGIPPSVANVAAAPQGYRGECSRREAEALPDGAWCFDRDARELVYHPRRDRYLRLQGSDGRNDAKLLRWRVTVPEAAYRVGFLGLRIEVVTPYVWQEE